MNGFPTPGSPPTDGPDAGQGTFLRSLLPILALLCLLALVPLAGTFATRLCTRVLILGLAAVSLDLLLGYGGMVSLGHAAYVGVGAYVAAIFSAHGIHSLWIVWPSAMAAAGLAALAIGAVCLRTTGVHFIMITLAFAQMVHYFLASLSAYGGDDGLALAFRNTAGAGLSLDDPLAFYYLCLAVLAGALALGRRIVASRFGLVLRGIRENERRVRSLGFSAYRYKLACFALSGAVAGFAGVLLANLDKYVSPSLTHWTRSGELLVMVILGGMGTLTGPVLGAAVFLLAEETLSAWTEHWMIILGPLLILVVLFARGGVAGLLHGTCGMAGRWLRRIGRKRDDGEKDS